MSPVPWLRKPEHFDVATALQRFRRRKAETRMSMSTRGPSRDFLVEAAPTRTRICDRTTSNPPGQSCRRQRRPRRAWYLPLQRRRRSASCRAIRQGEDVYQSRDPEQEQHNTTKTPRKFCEVSTFCRGQLWWLGHLSGGSPQALRCWQKGAGSGRGVHFRPIGPFSRSHSCCSGRGGPGSRS